MKWNQSEEKQGCLCVYVGKFYILVETEIADIRLVPMRNKKYMSQKGLFLDTEV